jgi:HK97 family phage major capsid protein
MNTRIKELNEKRGAKLKEASALITKAQTEKRELTADELKSVGTFQGEAENLAETIVAETRQFALEKGTPLTLSPDEKRDLGRFDYQKVLRHLHRTAKGQPSQIEGIELDMVQEGEKEAREAGIEPGGIMLPRVLVRRGGTDIERRDMTATGTTSTTGDQGGMTIQTNKAGLLDVFYLASALEAGGATVLEGLTGNLDVPRLVADGTRPVKKTENQAATENTPTTAMLSLTPKRLPSYIDIGEQLLKQSSSAIETILKQHLGRKMGEVKEIAFFHGGGTSEANGIAGTSGIGDVAGGTNGAAPTWANIVALETAVDTANAMAGNLRYFSNGQIRGKLKSTARVASTDSVMILDPRDNGQLNGYPASWTNAISRTLTKGNQSLSSAIFFGNPADYWIGYWGGIALEMIRDKTNATTGLYTLVASTYYDGGVVRAGSFAAMLDALGA